jgi:protein-S-isoprenylcysteine O-methyltransferase Ste14
MLFFFALIGVEYYFGFQLDLAYTKLTKYMVGSIIVAGVFGKAMFVKGLLGYVTQVNEDGNTGCTPHDLFHGRDKFPRFPFGLDVKLVVFRTGLMTWMLLVIAMLSNHYTKNGSFDPSVALVGAFQLVYCASFIVRERDSLLSTSMIRDPSGLAVWLTYLVFVPFTYCLPLRFVMERNLGTHPAYQFGCVFVFVVGMYLLTMANYQKAAFKSKTVPGMARIHGDKGHDLLIDGVWAWVRRPNYLGDILATIAWTMPCVYGFGSFVPFIPLALVITLLVLRTLEDEAGCKRRHGKAWDEYCRQVKYRLVPFIF